MLSCQDQAGHKVLTDSPATSCDSSEYKGYVALAYTVLIIYVVPFAFVIFGVLYNLHKKKLLR
jgi:hypothetical protein